VRGESGYMACLAMVVSNLKALVTELRVAD
jgi:hypothetical protein